VFVVFTPVNPVGIRFQLVGGVATRDGMQPTVTCPRVRLTFAVCGSGIAEVFWLTWVVLEVEGAPTLTSVHVPRFVAPL
jgi:hypothetical protein